MTFVDTEGDPATPESATLEIQAPDGSVESTALGDLTAGEVGSYTHSPTYDQAGEWIWRIVGVIGATAVVDTDRDWVWPNPITGEAA